MNYLKRPWSLLALVAVVALGCGTEEASQNSTGSSDPGNAKYALTDEPQGSIGIIKALETTKDGDEVVVVGRVGGAKVPWVKGLAAFRIVDASLKSCTEVGSDGCETPWDFC